MRTYYEIKKYVESVEFDDLGRGLDVIDFINVLLKTKFNHICLNGEWGSGKTTFVQNVINTISETKTDENVIVYFDAWKYENYDDPMLAIISCINTIYPDLISDTFEKHKVDFKPSLSLGFFGIDIETTRILGDKDIDAYVSKMYYQEKTMFVFNKLLDEVKGLNKDKLIIFIDELDRCRPEFAMSVLEKIHHTYPRDDIKFVYSTDIKQLKSMVKHHYGESYSSDIFFHKVFDTKFNLPILTEPYLKNYYESKFEKPSYYYCTISWDLIKIKTPPLRTINIIAKEISDFYNGKVYAEINDGWGDYGLYGVDNEYRGYYFNIFYCLIVLKNTDLINIENLTKLNNFSDIVAQIYSVLGLKRGFDKFLMDICNKNLDELEPEVTLDDVLQEPITYLSHCLHLLENHSPNNLKEIFDL